MGEESQEAGASLPDTRAYAELLEELKRRIRTARLRASVVVNREILQLYWELGRAIVTRQESEGWGSSVIKQISADLGKVFSGVRGFSASNIWRMRAFYLAYRGSGEKLARPMRDLDQGGLPSTVPNLPWGHQITLIERIKPSKERKWYAQMAEAQGWSRSVLIHQIESRLHERSGQAITNFERALPDPQSDLASELLKDPYHFDFLELGPEIAERDIERALLSHLRDFLLELGVGFAFIASQYRFEVGKQEYRLDLLFYHLRLSCFVAVDLKMGPFKPSIGSPGAFQRICAAVCLRPRSCGRG